MNVLLVQGLLLAFALVVILMPLYIRFLRYVGFGKRIRVDGPGTHLVKEGTPTMGGLLVIMVVGALALLLNLVDASTFAPLATIALVGALGALDDFLNVRTGDGLRGRYKVIWQAVVALIAAFNIQRTYHITALAVPFIGAVDIPAWAYIVFAAFAIVATCNGVNLTDGLDGLAGGTLIFAFVAYLIIALANAPLAQPNLAVLSALIIGALLGFLWFNVHPAQIFMGDSGSLSLGATLAVTALITGQVLILPLIGIIFVAEAGSDILQVGLLQADRRAAHPAHGPAAPPLRAGRLGRGEGHPPLLDRRRAGGDARRGLLPGHRGQAAVTAMTLDHPGPGTALLDLAAAGPRQLHRPPRGRPRARPQRRGPGALPGRPRRAGDRLRPAPAPTSWRRRSCPSRAARCSSGLARPWTRRRSCAARRSSPPRPP